MDRITEKHTELLRSVCFFHVSALQSWVYRSWKTGAGGEEENASEPEIKLEKKGLLWYIILVKVYKLQEVMVCI